MMIMWIIYDHPKDCPDKWVARMWKFDRTHYVPTSDVLTAAKLDTLRSQMMQHGLVCIARDPADDPTIVEAWL
jgi:hypothetical protein